MIWLWLRALAQKRLWKKSWKRYLSHIWSPCSRCDRRDGPGCEIGKFLWNEAMTQRQLCEKIGVPI